MYDQTYPASLKRLPNYAASENLSSLVQWKLSDTGHSLIQKTTQKLFVGVAVVHVYGYKLNCAPNGNYIKPELGSLDRAKFQFLAGRPADANFGEDYKVLYNNLAKLQQDIATTKEHRDMLSSDACGKMIRFARQVFTERDHVIPDSPRGIQYYEDIVNPREEENEKIDEETAKWPIDEKYRDALDLIKPTHRAVPLRVYQDDNFVEPQNVNSVLRNALIEVQFSIHHTYLGSQKPPRDSFRANIEQIVVLREGVDLHDTSYANLDPRSGPISAGGRGEKRSAEETKEQPRRKTRATAADEREKSRTTDERNEEATEIGPSTEQTLQVKEGRNTDKKGKRKASDIDHADENATNGD